LALLNPDCGMTILSFATTRSPATRIDSVIGCATGYRVLAALVVVLRSLALICSGHRAVALETLTGRILFVLVLLSHDRRRIVHLGLTEHPTAAWTAQQIVEALPDDTAPPWLLRDRDAIYGDSFHHRVTDRLVAGALAMGGTCSGDHGVGIGKRRLLEAEHGKDALEVVRAIKHALDLLDLMNPGNAVKTSATTRFETGCSSGVRRQSRKNHSKFRAFPGCKSGAMVADTQELCRIPILVNRAK
jgi:hypothetical protein